MGYIGMCRRIGLAIFEVLDSEIGIMFAPVCIVFPVLSSNRVPKLYQQIAMRK